MPKRERAGMQRDELIALISR